MRERAPRAGQEKAKSVLAFAHILTRSLSKGEPDGPAVCNHRRNPRRSHQTRRVGRSGPPSGSHTSERDLPKRAGATLHDCDGGTMS